MVESVPKFRNDVGFNFCIASCKKIIKFMFIIKVGFYYCKNERCLSDKSDDDFLSF